MAAIREINVGVSQLNEVVQQNAAAGHQLASTSFDLANQSSTLSHYVAFFQVDTQNANGRTAPHLSPPPAVVTSRRLPPPHHGGSGHHRGGGLGPDTHGPAPAPCRRIPPRKAVALRADSDTLRRRTAAASSLTLTTTTTGNA